MSTDIMTPIPKPPTPCTARRRRLSKLRRHFGEVVPNHLVTSADDSMVTTAIMKTRMITKIYNMGDDSLVFNKTALERIKSKEEEDEEDGEGEEEGFDLEESDEESASVESKDIYVFRRPSKSERDLETEGRIPRDKRPYQAQVRPKSNKRWFREKGSRRWEEENYEDILRTLRSL